VQGLELRLDARLDEERWVELGYALQQAEGVVSTAWDSAAGTQRIELPLQFDRRHAINLNAYWPLPLGLRVSVGGTAGSGYPIPGAADQRLPWSVAVAARLTRAFRAGGLTFRALAETRNLLNQANLVTARPGGGVMPDVDAINARAAAETAGAIPLPRESPWYLPGFDADGNGLLSPAEQTAARRAALLDAAEPTLLYGEAFQLRLGIEMGF
jgi:hypothetical protein